MAAARWLETQRAFFEAGGFPARMIDLVVAKLERRGRRGALRPAAALPAAERLAESRRLMHKDLHKH